VLPGRGLGLSGVWSRIRRPDEHPAFAPGSARISPEFTGEPVSSRLASGLHRVVTMSFHALVVEDHLATRLAMREYFEATGFRVDLAGTLIEAIDLLDRQDYAIVLADLRLNPDGQADGLDVVSAVRQRHPQVPILLVTALATPQVEAEALRRGANAVLTKPRPLPEVLEVSMDLIRRSETQAAG